MKLSQITTRKFIESYSGNGRKILTPSGYKKILEVHKTIPYRKFRIELDNGLSLECAYNHVIIDENNTEIYSKDSLDSYIKTVNGISRVIAVMDLEIEEHMYDISIDSEDELYYSNGILSHNSGKSISTGIYLCHQYNFNKELNIGIVANKGAMAREFLSNVKNMFIELPIWMQQGTLVWNQGSIQNESKMRILTDVPSSDSFRGYSIHCLDGKSEVEVYDKIEKCYKTMSLEELYDNNKDNLLIKTQSGYKDFDGIRRIENVGLIIKTQNTEIRCTEDHRILVGKCKSGKIYRRAKTLNVSNKIKNNLILKIEKDKTKKYYYDLINVRDGNNYLSNSITHHNCLVIDENAFIRPSVWEAFSDSIFPAQSGLSWKKNISISTANGMNFFYNLVKAAREGTNETKIFEVNWEDVPRYDTDGTIMEPEKFKDKIVKKHGLVYFEQNYGNNFVGSSHTLIDAGALEKFISNEPLEIRDGKLKIYKYPEKGHQYICSVDAAKDGIDDFAVQITDITNFKFEQVAASQLQIDYLLMPEYLNDWCQYYNNPYLIIENNEGAGASIADQMYLTYEYENLHFDIDSTSKKKKKYPGFRTTSKSRKLILQTLKLFIDNNNLTIHDKKTINQFYTFILLNNKYQADENCKDDAIMSMAIAFAPFCNSKNFEDMKELVKRLYNEFDENIEGSDKDFIEYLTFGSFDDGTEEHHIESADYNNFSYIVEPDGFY